MQDLIFRVIFTMDHQRFELMVGDIDLTHPYFVCLKKLEWRKRSNAVVLVNEDAAYKRFGCSHVVYIPTPQIISMESLNREHYYAIVAPSKGELTILNRS